MQNVAVVATCAGIAEALRPDGPPMTPKVSVGRRSAAARAASDSGETFAVDNPGHRRDDRRSAAHGRRRDATRARAAEEALPAWRGLLAKDRARILRRWSDLMLENTEPLARLLTTEQGKPLAESRVEIAYAASFLEWFGEEAKRVYGDTIPTYLRDRRIVVTKEPVGVTAGITPWNFPAAMVTRKAAPALAAGCTMVLKPAEQTPLSALAVAQLGVEAGLPGGVLGIVTGSAEDAPVIGRAMTSSPLVRKLGFTGSTEVGKLLMAQCAGQVKKVSLELGGNAPFIVFDDADLDEAVAGALICKFRNSGQTCISANRILVQAPVYDEFVQRLAAQASRLKVGSGLEPDTRIGPLIEQQAVDKVERHVADALERGGELLTGGERLGGLFYSPTVITGVSPAAAMACEETFGPVAGDRALRDARRRRSGRRTTRPTASPRTSTAATSAGSGVSPRGSSTGSSASTPASSRPRSRRSAA